MVRASISGILRGADECKGLRTLHDASLPGASYDSAVRESALYSIPKAQDEEFVDKFTAWGLQEDTPFSVMWLNRPKSTLAQICTEKLEDQVAATFFFSRAHGIDDPRRFFTTLADQLSIHIPPYAALLDARLRRNPALVSKSLKVQFRELIVTPFRELLAQGVDLGRRRLIIVEGIDECQEVEARCEIIRIILESAGEFGFRWAIFGERDHRLETRLMGWESLTESCWRIDHSNRLSSVDGDGRVYTAALIQHRGSVTLQLDIATCSTEIVTSTALFFFF